VRITGFSGPQNPEGFCGSFIKNGKMRDNRNNTGE